MLVYLLTNRVTGKRYVGQTRMSLESRWKSHQYAARHQPYCRLLYASIRKHGAEAFIVEAIGSADTQAALDALEVEAIQRYGTLAPTGYNLRRGGGRGAIHAETRELMRLAHVGRPKSAEWRDAIRRANTGKKYPPERIEAMRLARWEGRDYHHSAETKAKISAVSKGKPWTLARRRAYERRWGKAVQ